MDDGDRRVATRLFDTSHMNIRPGLFGPLLKDAVYVAPRIESAVAKGFRARTPGCNSSKKLSGLSIPNFGLCGGFPNKGRRFGPDERSVNNIISEPKCASIILDESLYLMPCQVMAARKDGNPPGRILLRVTSGQRCGAKTMGSKGDRPGETSNPPYSITMNRLRAGQKIICHFRIPSSGRLHSLLNLKVLKIVHYSCGFELSDRTNPAQIRARTLSIYFLPSP